MRQLTLLPANGNAYKSNLHCHTTYSDGRLTPEEIKQAYQNQGYTIVAFTDHRTYRYHAQLTDSHFLALAGLEVDINDFGDYHLDFSRLKTYHFNLYDTNPEKDAAIKEHCLCPQRRYTDTAYINRYIEEMNALGFMVCYNHPYWSLQGYTDYKDLRGLWAMEIYNHGCELDGLYGYHPQCYDEMLRSGQTLYCVSTDDNHNAEPFDAPLCDSFGGFTMIHAKELTYPAVIRALQDGQFYSSMGPLIHELSITGNTLTIKTSPCVYIYVKTQGRDCYKQAAKPGEHITEAKFILSGKEGYIRLDIQDSEGKHANSNAYFLTSLL